MKRSLPYKYISKKLLAHNPLDKFILVTPAAYGGEGLLRYAILWPGEIFCKSYIGFICES